jgi:acetyltransferase-like isoleucine patch superfamily enzyme
MPYLSQSAIANIGLQAFGHSCLIDETAIFLSPERIRLADEVRIDAYSLLNAGSGVIELDRRVHLASHVRLIGGGGIHFAQGSGASSGVCVYSQSDDFTDGFLAHPTIPIELRKLTSVRVEVGPFAIIGPNSTLLPGVVMGTGAVLGAMSLLKSSVPRLEIHAGIPAKKIGNRDETEFLRNVSALGLE